MTWSVDHENVLPDHDLGPGATANQAFRRLLQDRLLMDEQVFSGIRSPYLADGDLGVEPDFAQAVGPGENHWMLVGHLKMNSAGNTPLFFENALSPNWPLQWRDGWNMPEIRGRTWRGTVLVYHMDGSMNAVRLDQGREGLVLPDSAFPFQWRTKAPKILDVEDAR
ncbi:hypothetical protein [Prosthecobacter debontii]|nr:hypothetical protein [Prosthecobacter debontii]